MRKYHRVNPWLAVACVLALPVIGSSEQPDLPEVLPTCNAPQLLNPPQVLSNAERQPPRFLDGSRGMGPCVRRDDNLLRDLIHLRHLLRAQRPADRLHVLLDLFDAGGAGDDARYLWT